MKAIYNTLILLGLITLIADPAYSAWQSTSTPTTLPSLTYSQKGPILIAKKRKKRKGRKLRQKHLSGEARNKRGKTNINFDEASIDGRRRLPPGVAITKNRPDHDYDLINLRLRWHPEMIQSTTNLETGKGR